MSTMRRMLESGKVRTSIRKINGRQRFGLFYWEPSGVEVCTSYGYRTIPKGWVFIPEFGTYKKESDAIREATEQFGHEPEASKNYRGKK